MNRALQLVAALAALALLLAACDEADPEAEEPEEAVEEPEEEDEPEEDEPEEAEEDEYDVADQPDDATVSFVEPADGDTVEAPVAVEFEVDGFELTEVGDPAVGEGHLHVLAEEDCVGNGEVVAGPSDELEENNEIFHLSDGQDADELDLDPGEYDLCVQIGDSIHQAFGESDEISVTVE